MSQAMAVDARNRVLNDRGNSSNLNDSGQQQLLTLQGEVEAATTTGPKAILIDANIPTSTQFYNNTVNIVPVDRALARMSQVMVIEAGNKVLNERGNGSVIVTTAEGDRPRIATTKQPHNAVGYEVVTVNGKGHEHESVEDLEKENATASRFEKMENSARVLQSNRGAWKTTIALTPTVDQAAFDPLVTVAGGCRPITDAIDKAISIKSLFH